MTYNDYQPLDIPQARYHCGGSTMQLREEREKLLDRIEYLQDYLKELLEPTPQME